MLVLQRRAGQTVHIDGRIVIHVIRATDGSLKFGIEAPEDISIVRGELLERTAVKD